MNSFNKVMFECFRLQQPYSITLINSAQFPKRWELVSWSSYILLIRYMQVSTRNGVMISCCNNYMYIKYLFKNEYHYRIDEYIKHLKSDLWTDFPSYLIKIIWNYFIQCHTYFMLSFSRRRIHENTLNSYAAWSVSEIE